MTRSLSTAPPLILGQIAERSGGLPGRASRGPAFAIPHHRRTEQPVRRHSYRKGREGLFWQPISRQDARRIVFAARRYELDTKERGRRNGALGHVALEVITYLAHLVDYRTGRLEPSIATLMRKLHRSRGAIVRALKTLRGHGFLDWIRRYERTGGQGVRGPQVQQTSNAYRMMLPARAAKLIGRYFTPPPMPADAEQHETEKAAEALRYTDSLSRADYAVFACGDLGP